MIDIGVNLTSSQFNDVSTVLSNAQENNVKKIIVTGTSVQESKNAISLCQDFEEMFPNMLHCTVGIHPHEASSFSSSSLKELKNLAKHECVVAIGETGLDYYRNLSSKEIQVKSFSKHIELAIEIGLPLFLHERDAFDDQIKILKSFGQDLPKSVIHCFTGSQNNLAEYLDLGMQIGITGWICDKKRGENLRAIVNQIPIDKLMMETDSPYLLPQNIPKRPKKRINEPAFLDYVASQIALNRHESLDEIKFATTENATAFFNLAKE